MCVFFVHFCCVNLFYAFFARFALMYLFIVEYISDEFKYKSERCLGGLTKQASLMLHMRSLVFEFGLSLIDIQGDSRALLTSILNAAKPASSKTIYDIPSIIRSYWMKSGQEFSQANTKQKEVCFFVSLLPIIFEFIFDMFVILIESTTFTLLAI